MATTQMVAEPAKTDMRVGEKVTLKFLRNLEYKETKYNEGHEYEVEKPLAREILAMKTDGTYAFFGSRDTTEATRNVIKYAEVVRAPEDIF